MSILTDVSELQEDEIRINSHEIEIIIKSVKNRPDLDVTDQLWEVLKCKYLSVLRIFGIKLTNFQKYKQF